MVVRLGSPDLVSTNEGWPVRASLGSVCELCFPARLDDHVALFESSMEFSSLGR